MNSHSLNRNSISAAAMLLMLAMAAPGHAQAPITVDKPLPAGTIQDQTPPATLREAAQIGVTRSPDVLARWHALRASEFERDAAKGGLYPRVDLSSSVGTERRSETSSGTRSITSLSLNQLLYDGFATRDEIRRLDHASRVRLFEFLDASETTALESVRAYIDVLRFRALVRLAEENFVEHRTVYGKIDQRVRARIARAVDMEQVTGRVALSEANLLTETANLHDTTARFQRVIGRLPAKQMAVPDAITRDLPPDMRAAIELAQQRNPALRAAIESVRASGAALGARDSAYRPRFDFRVRRDQSSNASQFNGGGSGTLAEVVLSWNLFNGFADVNRERQFAQQLGTAQEVRDKTCRDIRQTLMIAYNDTRKLTEQLRHLEAHEAAVAKALVAYRQQFDIGQRSLLDLLDTENELFQARRAVVNARHDWHLAYARTHAAGGNLLRALELRQLDVNDAGISQQWSAAQDSAQHCPPEMIDLDTSTREDLMVRVAERAAARPALPSQAVSEAGPVPPSRPHSVDSASAPAPRVTGTANPEPAAAANDRELRTALETWRKAWSDKNIPAYLATYAAGFASADGASRTSWEQRRRAIIGRSQDVNLTLTEIQSAVEGERATTSFVQSYRSASYQDQVRKVLEWRKYGGQWLIVSETTR